MSEYLFVTNIFEYLNIRIYSSHSALYHSPCITEALKKGSLSKYALFVAETMRVNSQCEICLSFVNSTNSTKEPCLPAQTRFSSWSKDWREVWSAKRKGGKHGNAGEDWQGKPQYSLRPLQNNPPSSH